MYSIWYRNFSDNVDMLDAQFAKLRHTGVRDADNLQTAWMLARLACVHRIQLSLGLDWNGQKEICTIMAKNDTNTGRAKWQGFININLTRGDKDAVETYKLENAERGLEALIGVFIKVGNKLSISWDEKNDCFMVAMRCDDPDSPNGGWCVTSRSSDVTDALWISMYKHYVLCEGDWTTFQRHDTFTWG